MRLTTLCAGRICVGYRTLHNTDTALSRAVGVAGAFTCAFAGLWALVVLILLIYERLRGEAIGTYRTGGERGGVVREVVLCHARVEERCPLVVFKGDEGDSGCAVCLEEMDDGVIARVLSCGHVFHAGCIDRWVLQSVAKGGKDGPCCPLCKTPVLGMGMGKGGREGEGEGGRDVVEMGEIAINAALESV